MAIGMIGPKFYGQDANGKPLAYGKLYTYRAGTTDPKDTFKGEAGDVANTNPIILNGEGWAEVYLSGSYNMILHSADDVPIWSQDPVSENNLDEWSSCAAAIYVSPDSFQVSGNVTDTYDQGRSVRLEQGASFLYSTIIDSSYAGGFTTIVITDPVVTVSLTGICASIVGANSTGGGYVSNLSTEAMLVSTRSFSDLVLVKEYYTGSGFGSAIWVKTGATGTPGTTDFGNGLLVDGSGDQRKIQEIKITPAMFGAKADGTNSDHVATQHAFNYSDITRFDRMYYTLETINLPSSPAGKTVEGVNSETSGITTLDGFAGDEKDVTIMTSSGATITVGAVAHGLTTGDSIFVYGATQEEYNGYYDSVTVTTVDAFSADGLMVFPTNPVTTATGTIKIRKCKPVLTVDQDSNYEKFTMKDFKIDGSLSVESACGNAIDFRYHSGMSNGNKSLYRAKLENLRLSAYGGAGVYLKDAFACDFERIYASSVLYHGIWIDDSSGATTFNHCDILGAGRKKAGLYSRNSVSVNAMNIVGGATGASYGIWAGESTDTSQDENIIPTVNITNCSFAGYFLNHLIFAVQPRGIIENNTFYLLDANTNSFFLAATQSKTFDSSLMLNGNKYVKGAFNPAIDHYVVDNILSFSGGSDNPELFFVVSDQEATGYTVNSGSHAGTHAFTNMQNSYIKSHISIDSSDGTSIDVFGKSFINITDGTTKSKLVNGSDGDRVRLVTDLGTIVIEHSDGLSPDDSKIFNKSLNDITMIAGKIYEFEFRDSIWYQIDSVEPEEFHISIPNESDFKIAGPLPLEAATHTVTVISQGADGFEEDLAGIKHDIISKGGASVSDVTIFSYMAETGTTPVLYQPFVEVESGYLYVFIRHPEAGSINWEMNLKINRVS
jgi:hypothetical protein